MSGVQQRLKLKQTPIDTWSLKEQLTLASAVLRTGDQNWVSVSRTMKQFWEPGRPPDWYSQKNCALQYNLILEKADLPRRKRGEKLEGKDSPGETIVRALAEQRKVQLAAILEEEKQLIARLEKQVELLSDDKQQLSESDLAVILAEVEAEEEEEARKDAEHAAFIRQRDEKKQAIQAALKTGLYWKGQHAAHSEQSGSEIDSAQDSPQPPPDQDSLNEQIVDSKDEGTTSLNSSPIKNSDAIKQEKDSPLLTDLLTSPSKLPIIEEVVEVETTSTTSPHVPDAKEKLAVSVKQEQKDEEEAGEENKIIVVDDEVAKKIIKTEAQVKAEVKEEITEAVTSQPKKEPAESTDVTESAEDEVDDDVINDAEEITADHLAEDLDEEKSDQAQEDKENKDATNDAKEADKEDVEDLEKKDGGAKDEDGLTSEGFTEKEETAENETKSEDKEEASVIESSNTNESLATSATSQPMEVDVDETAAESTDEAGKPRPDQVEEDAKGRAGSGAEASAAKLRVGGAKDDVSKAVDLPEPEAPITKMTPRRGRPRAKKLTDTPSAAADAAKEETDTAAAKKDPEAAGTGSRPTSPSPEVKTRSHSRESESGGSIGVKESGASSGVKESGGSSGIRVGSRRSSRPSGSRGGVTSSGSGSRPVSPAAGTEDEKDHKTWKKSILIVLSQIAAHKHASLFAGPVSEAEAPEYRQIVLKPIDLGTIKKNIENGTIRKTVELQRDLALMFLNATMYNSSDHDVYKLTMAMQRDTNVIIKEFLNTQALLRASENPKLRMKEMIEDGPRARTRTGSGSFTPDDRKKTVEDKRKRTSTLEEYPAAKKRRLRNLDE